MLKRRWEWFAGQLDLDPEKLIFIDETGASTVTGANFRAEGESESAKCDSSYE